MAQTHFAGFETVAGEQDVDFGIADVGLALHDALLQALHQELVAQVIAEILETHVFAGERAAQLIHGDLVVLGDALHGLVDVGVADANAGVLGARHLQAQHDQALQHLAVEHVARRQLLRIGAVLVEDVGDGRVELALQDDVVVDHGDDAIQRLRGQQGLRLQAGPGAERGHEETQAKDDSVHRKGIR